MTVQLDEFKTRQRGDVGRRGLRHPVRAHRRRRRARRRPRRHRAWDARSGRRLRDGQRRHPGGACRRSRNRARSRAQAARAGKGESRGRGARAPVGRGRRRAAPLRGRVVRPRPLDLRAHVRTPAPADGRRDDPCVPSRRCDRHRDVDAGRSRRRNLRGGRLVHAAAARLRVAADPVGTRGLRARDVRIRRRRSSSSNAT